MPLLKTLSLSSICAAALSFISASSLVAEAIDTYDRKLHPCVGDLPLTLLILYHILILNVVKIDLFAKLV